MSEGRARTLEREEQMEQERRCCFPVTLSFGSLGCFGARISHHIIDRLSTKNEQASYGAEAARMVPLYSVYLLDGGPRI